VYVHGLFKIQFEAACLSLKRLFSHEQAPRAVSLLPAILGKRSQFGFWQNEANHALVIS
jgi:hypothetical protein